jgi:hypothetical protein
MSDDPITKRLHISGLTASITADDLSRRIGSYGTVEALDGLGKRDVLGALRPYAYVTLHTTRGQLARCMSALSGAMWKGARLRVGEARPDFRERCVHPLPSLCALTNRGLYVSFSAFHFILRIELLWSMRKRLRTQTQTQHALANVGAACRAHSRQI